ALRSPRFLHFLLLQLAKPTRRDLFEETILAERVREEERREQAIALRVFNHYRKACAWHKAGEAKWMHRAAERKVQVAVQQYLAEIDVRRDRLRDFLEAEESRHFAEVEALHEQKVQDTEVQMKEQAKLLREKRERERLQVVAEKREQQFRNRCEEYRIHCKKRSEKELGDCQLAQQTLKQLLKKEEKMQELKLEEMCEKEQLAKDQEAELKAQEVAAQLQEMMNVREAQVAVQAALREEEKQEMRKEAERLDEDLHQFRKETEELERKRRHQQEECRKILLKAVQDKKQHLDKEKQTQLAEDKKILENDFQDPNKEYEQIRKKKQALLEEQHTYLDHLAEQLRRDKEQEREDEELFQEERDKLWAEKVEKMKEEREVRFQLLREVVKTRESQVEEKLQKKAARKIEIAQEKAALAKAAREFEREEEEKRIRYFSSMSSVHFFADQSFRLWLQKAEEEQRKKEHESNMEAEREYQKRVKLILSMPNESVVQPP
ncbi:CFA53 protein, partial [Drymodes brunneopygia]|nr:CFA53 protein [Drymodes brunneopygia]